MTGKTILVADDEKPIRCYLERKLTREGYRVLLAEEGEEALQKALLDLPDLVLLDVRMPKLSGIEVCRRIRAHPRTRHIPVIMLSARAQFAEIGHALEAGAQRYLCKPIGFPELLREIRRLEAGAASGGKPCWERGPKDRGEEGNDTPARKP